MKLLYIIQTNFALKSVNLSPSNKLLSQMKHADGNIQSPPPAQAGSSLADFSTLKIEAILSSETSVHTRTTRRRIPENGILLMQIRCKNL
jgi:hypothetical protein